jgi:hypothetical protein
MIKTEAFVADLVLVAALPEYGSFYRNVEYR